MTVRSVFTTLFLKGPRHFFTILLVALVSNLYGQEKTINQGLEVLSDLETLNKNASQIISEIDGAYNYVKSSGAYKTLVDGQSPSFPYAIVGGDDKNYALIVNDVKLDPIRGMRAEIMMKIPVNSEKSLYFLADNIPLSKNGKLQGELNLFLVKTDSVSFGEGYNIVFKGLDNPNKAYSYVTFDCKGFKEVFINGGLNFHPNSVVEHSEGSGPKKPLKLGFFINADKLANMVIQFSNIPAIEFKRLPGFKCEVKEITLDYSELRNAPGFDLPGWYLDSLSKKYESLDKDLYSSVVWEGVYIPSITIEIPRKFTEGSPEEIVTIKSEQIIVDHYGITALTKASNVLSGDLKGFKYSVDSLRLNLIANTLSKAGFYGGMSFPICKEESEIAYGLTISKSMKTDSDLEYYGYASAMVNLNVKAFGMAQINLSRCDLEFTYKNKQFFPKATIDGGLTVAAIAKNDSTPAGNIGVEFGGLVLNSESPYIGKADRGFFMKVKAGDLSNKMAGLPITIKDNPDFIFGNNGQRFGLGLSLAINLQKSSGEKSESSSGFSGDASFTIWAKRSASSKRWSYDDFDLTSINIKADLGAVVAAGSLKMFNGDPTYGKGFCGKLQVDIIEKIKVEASAIFGKQTDMVVKDTMTIYNALLKGENLTFNSTDEDTVRSAGKTLFRYWFMDSKITFTPGIPIGTGIEINAFTGGIYYNMEMVKPDDEASMNTKVECNTVTGRKYNPEQGILGLIAGIGVQSTGTGTVFNGDINFGIEFSLDGFGVRRVATWGGIKIMETDFAPSGLDKLGGQMSLAGLNDSTQKQTEKTEPPKTAVAANWFVQYDVPNKELEGHFDVYIDLFDVVKGSGADGKAGRISIYSSGTTGQWYLYVGQPIEGHMIGVEVFNLAKIGGYFCVGSILPTPPIAPMPEELRKELEIDYNLLAMGGGMSFGARLELDDNPGVELWPCDLGVELRYFVYAGFDILISQSQMPIECSGYKERGINRWYATGQTYIYGGASLRAKYDCKFKSGDLDILSVYLKAYVFAQLPRPTYVKGSVQVGFRVLGISFNEGFDIEAGEICSTNVLESNVDFIEAIKPADGHEEVAVGSPINVFFSNPIDDFTYSIKTAESSTNLYRGHVFKQLVNVMHGKDSLPFDIQFSPERDQMSIRPHKVLPENAEIKVIVRVVTQYKKGKEWISVTTPPEKMVVTFKTAAEPNYIPKPDIYYAYPLPDMESFYMNETRGGYIRLSVLPNKAVNLAPGYEFNLGIFEGSNEIGRTRLVEYSDNHGENNFTFSIPNMSMETNKWYSLKIMKSPIPDPTKESFTKIDSSRSYGTVYNDHRDTIILEYNFKTSSSKTFKAKMSALNTTYSEVFDGIIATNLSINKSSESGVQIESLSDEEMHGYIIEGIQVTDPLIRFVGLDYSDESLTAFQNKFISQDKLDEDISSSDVGGLSVISNAISATNAQLKDLNMKCLLEGGCSEKEQAKINIPKGEITVNIGYYLPGQDQPINQYPLAINLDKNLTLPQ